MGEISHKISDKMYPPSVADRQAHKITMSIHQFGTHEQKKAHDANYPKKTIKMYVVPEKFAVLDLKP